jgi:hypothetical protein
LRGSTNAACLRSGDSVLTIMSGWWASALAEGCDDAVLWQGWEGTAAGVPGSLSLTWGCVGDIIVPIMADGTHPAFRPTVSAIHPNWITACITLAGHLPLPKPLRIVKANR